MIHEAILTDQSDFEPILYQDNIYFKPFRTFSMVGFNFDHGGRRCIRPILEKYQSGKSKDIHLLSEHYL